MVQKVIESLSPKQLRILQEALGADQYGQRPARETRNSIHLQRDAVTDAMILCRELEAMKLLKCHGPLEWNSDLLLFRVTAKGKASMQRLSPPPPW